MLELNDKTFTETLENTPLVAVDFWADWCVPCKMFSPILEEAADELDGKAVFAKLNVDDYGELAQKYTIASIPTVLLFKDGELVERSVGVKPKEGVLELINKYL